MGRGESSLGLLALSAETTESTLVSLDINAGFLLEVSHAVLDEPVVEIFSTQVSVTIGGLDFENTVLDGKEGHIKSATTKIEDEHIALSAVFLVETVGNGGSGRLVDDS